MLEWKQKEWVMMEMASLKKNIKHKIKDNLVTSE